MLNVKKITITQKVIFLGASALVGILLIIGSSLTIFNKISDISKMATHASVFEKSYHRALQSFNRYSQLGEADDYKAFVKHISYMIYLPQATVSVNQALKSLGSKDKALKELLPKFNNSPAIVQTVNLQDTLKGKPVLDELVSNCNRSLKIGLQIKSLGEKYSSADSDEKKRIVKEIESMSPIMDKQLDEFYDILDQIMTYLKGTVIKLFIGFSLVMLVVISLITVMVVRSLIKPLRQTVAFAQALSQGDLSKKIEINTQDELGKVCEALNMMGEELGSMIGNIKGDTGTLSSASNELAGISGQMSQNSQDTSGKTEGVLTSADTMSATMNLVTQKMDETTHNTEVMATAVEEMSSTITEIAKNAETARNISLDANEKTQEASVLMGDLGKAADDIGKVIETITDISEQVNLLALNATIEAARAGEAGKGFTVVANEIKELARQTAEATHDIKQKIETIQQTTKTTVSQNQEITGVIEKVNEIIAGIASAVEEQSAATREIADTVANTSQAISDVNQHVVSTTTEASDIHNAITEVNSSAADMVKSSHQVSDSSKTLSNLADKLENMVSRFKV